MAPRPVLFALALLSGTSALGGAAVWQSEQVWAAERRSEASHAAAAAGFALEQQVSRALSAAYTLAVLVKHDPRVDDFEQLAAEILAQHGAVSNLQLAPGAVVARIHPLAGNEAAIGHDLLRDPARRAQAEAAISSRRLTVAGPFELRQGGVGLLGRLAVFLPGPGPGGGERLWGLVTALVRLEPLLEAARLDHLAQRGYSYRLTLVDPDLRRERCFAGCEAALADPVSIEVGVPDGAWTLAVAPAGGWPPAPWRAAGWALVAASALAVAFLGLQLARQPALLRRRVEERTAELARANAALATEMARLAVAEEEARTAREELRQAQKMDAIGKLAGGIAHDFNNLLTGILGYASVLREESPPGSPGREAAETIGAAARRASELTRQLLGFARRRPAQAVPFDAHETVRDVARLAGPSLAPRIELVLALAAPRAVVVGDPGALQQALLNLVMNARDAMPAGGALRLESALREPGAPRSARPPEPAGPHLTLSVADSGHGIAPELLDRIFEPFFTTKEPGHGTGLGLAMVYGIARAHGGRVEVESAPGRGARFTLSLPLAPPGVEPLARAPAPAAGPRRSGTVLVVDDDPVPRAATAAMLGAAGYLAVEVGSAREGVRWVEEHPGEARAVVIDVAMPGVDGVEGLAALRRLDPTLRAVFITGYTRDPRAQDAAARGEAGFLPKPFDLQQLVAALEAAPAGGARA